MLGGWGGRGERECGVRGAGWGGVVRWGDGGAVGRGGVWRVGGWVGGGSWGVGGVGEMGWGEVCKWGEAENEAGDREKEVVGRRKRWGWRGGEEGKVGMAWWRGIYGGDGIG